MHNSISRMDVSLLALVSISFASFSCATDSGISPQYLGALEWSADSDSIDVIENLALALAVDPAELLQKGSAAGKARSRPSR